MVKRRIRYSSHIPKIYFDTSIIRELIEKEPPFLVNLMSTIKERNWTSYTSAYTILELCDLKKDDVYLMNAVKRKLEYKRIIRDRDQKNLSSADLEIVYEYINKFLKKYSYLSTFQIPETAWEHAYKITLNSNIHANDAVHVAVAWLVGADVILTRDSHLIKESEQLLKKYKRRLKVILPEQIYDTLASLGFKME